jgi:hypothetical protein
VGTEYYRIDPSNSEINRCRCYIITGFLEPAAKSLKPGPALPFVGPLSYFLELYESLVVSVSLQERTVHHEQRGTLDGRIGNPDVAQPLGATNMQNDGIGIIEYEPFQDNGQWWYWQVDDTLAGPFKTRQRAQTSANRESLTMYTGDE